MNDLSKDNRIIPENKLKLMGYPKTSGYLFK